MKSYDFRNIERKWRKSWEKEKLFEVKQSAFSSPRSKNKYILDMFPYPSGEGLHVGHVEGYTASDIISRFYRMQGYNVLHPMGWDAFGLPAENYAIKHKIHPTLVVKKNVSVFKKQLKSLGFSYDWSREVNTTDPDYYKWTQWIFLQLFKEGLAYEKEVPVNWCPSCKTVLSDEEAEGGVCDRCGSKVERKNLKQWMLKITAYADKLLEGLESLNWPERVKTMQRNWIGRSDGAHINFLLSGAALRLIPKPVKNIAPSGGITFSSGGNYFDYVSSVCKSDEWVRIADQKVRVSRVDKLSANMWRHYFDVLVDDRVVVFTTRPDTIFGATYLVVAPEHPLAFFAAKYAGNQKAVNAYLQSVKNKSDQERVSEGKEKTGVELEGIKAVNPANGKKIPVWVADYVLPYYGTGAIMAVPAHDQRDWDFAKKFNLPIVPVISPDGKTTIDEEVYEGDGILVNSGKFDGKKNRDQIPFMIDFVGGKKETQFKLRDWIFSRQRYWGEPIPLIFCENCKKSMENNKFQISNSKQNTKFTKGELLNPGWIPVSEKDLPLKLPDVKKYEPTGTLQSPLATVKSWVNTVCPRCGGPAKRETNTMPQWAGSCWYYLRYIDPKNKNKIIDPKKEKEFMPVDMYIGGVEHAVLHLLYARFWHKFLYDKKVVKDPEPFARLVNQGLILGSDGEKMSKSRGNVVNPDEIIEKFGADSLRMYEMFMGPLEDSKPWSEKGIIGNWRFLNRIWIYYQKQFSKPLKYKSADISEFERLFHQTLKKVTEDIETLHFNTAISSLMILFKEIETTPSIPKKYASDFIAMLSVFAPFISEEIWRGVMGNKKSILTSAWPEVDKRKTMQELITIAVQINGRTRGTISAKKGISKEKVLESILANLKLGNYIKDVEIKRVIFVPDKIINILL